MVALGPKALALAGEVADGVVLHTYFTDETRRPHVAAVEGRRGGRGQATPPALRVWACSAVVGTRSRTTWR